MELLLVFLSTAIGTIVGVGIAILMMNRRHRTPTIGDAALRTQLQNTEWALAAAGKDVEEMRKQLTEHEGVRDELERTQQQLAAMLADKEKQTAERAAAEQRASEMAEELSSARERALAGEEAYRRVAELDTALAAVQERANAMGDDAERRVIELEASLAAAEERASVAEGAVDAAEARTVECARESGALREQVAALSAEASSRAGAAVSRISTLEAEVEALQAQAQRASSTIEELEGMLRKERQSAVEAMELLSLAQDKFSGRFAAAR